MTDRLSYRVQRLREGHVQQVARFRTLADATRFIEARQTDGPWDILMPDGRRFSERNTVVPGPRRGGRKKPHDTLTESWLPSVAR